MQLDPRDRDEIRIQATNMEHLTGQKRNAPLSKGEKD